ncbi:MAG: PqqD family protein [Myxococcales bacterium]|nr:PqqD family protein [Myxococcales bacterium]
MNATAAWLWKAHLEGRTCEEMVERLSREARIHPDEARRAVHNALSLVADGNSQKPDRASPDYLYGIDAPEHGLVGFRYGQSPLFDFVPEELLLRPRRLLTMDVWRRHLWTLAPNLLAMMGFPALHAAAVAVGGSAIVFSGHSGAGKTTMAKMLSEAVGGFVLSEDKLVLDSGRSHCAFFAGAESFIRDWIDGACESLIRGTGTTRALRLAASGPVIPIQKVLFLHELDRQRDSQDITMLNMERPEALSFVLKQTFTGLNSREGWVQKFTWVRDLIMEVPIARLVVPLGLESLRHATRNLARDLMV